MTELAKERDTRSCTNRPIVGVKTALMVSENGSDHLFDAPD